MLIAGGLLVTCVLVAGHRPRGPGNLPTGVRPDPRHGMDRTSRDTAELGLPLAGAGRVGGAVDRYCDAPVPVRGGMRDSGVPAGHPQLRGRRSGDGGQPAGSMAAAGPGGALARRHGTRRPKRNVGVRHRRGGAARLPTGGGSRVAIDHHRRTESAGRGDQRTGAHAHLSRRTPREQHDQRADAVVVGSAQLPWPIISDSQVLDAMTSPVCAAYIGSC